MLLNDLFGWYKRNITTWSTYNKRKALDELREIVKFIEEDIKKTKGGVKHGSC